MRLIIILSILVVLISSCSSKSKSEPFAEEVWENYLATFGDRSQIENLKSSYSRMLIYSPTSVDTFYLYKKEPRRVYRKLSTQSGVVTEYYLIGEDVFIKQGNNHRQLEGTESLIFKMNVSLYPEINYKAFGVLFQLEKDRIINDVPHYSLKLSYDDWFVFYTIDKQTFECIEMLDDKGFTNRMKSDSINGLRYIKEFIADYNGTEVRFVYDDYQLDIEISDSIFEMY